MRLIKRIATAKQQADEEWRSLDEWTRGFVAEMARLGYNPNPHISKASDSVDGVGRVYYTGVGARGLSIVVRVEADTTKVLRVAIGNKSFTARQATLWLRKRAPRDDHRQHLT